MKGISLTSGTLRSKTASLVANNVAKKVDELHKFVCSLCNYFFWDTVCLLFTYNLLWDSLRHTTDPSVVVT